MVETATKKKSGSKFWPKSRLGKFLAGAAVTGLLVIGGVTGGIGFLVIPAAITGLYTGYQALRGIGELAAKGFSSAKSGVKTGIKETRSGLGSMLKSAWGKYQGLSLKAKVGIGLAIGLPLFIAGAFATGPLAAAAAGIGLVTLAGTAFVAVTGGMFKGLRALLGGKKSTAEPKSSATEESTETSTDTETVKLSADVDPVTGMKVGDTELQDMSPKTPPTVPSPTDASPSTSTESPTDAPDTAHTDAPSTLLAKPPPGETAEIRQQVAAEIQPDLAATAKAHVGTVVGKVVDGAISMAKLSPVELDALTTPIATITKPAVDALAKLAGIKSPSEQPEPETTPSQSAQEAALDQAYQNIGKPKPVSSASATTVASESATVEKAVEEATGETPTKVIDPQAEIEAFIKDLQELMPKPSPFDDPLGADAVEADLISDQAQQPSLSELLDEMEQQDTDSAITAPSSHGSQPPTSLSKLASDAEPGMNKQTAALDSKLESPKPDPSLSSDSSSSPAPLT